MLGYTCMPMSDDGAREPQPGEITGGLWEVWIMLMHGRRVWCDLEL